jgi:hypothetical protein
LEIASDAINFFILPPPTILPLYEELETISLRDVQKLDNFNTTCAITLKNFENTPNSLAENQWVIQTVFANNKTYHDAYIYYEEFDNKEFGLKKFLETAPITPSILRDPYRRGSIQKIRRITI